MIYALWYGGPSYSHSYIDTDVETFTSLSAARQELQRRENGGDPYYPAVEQSEMTVWKTDPRGDQDAYPDYLLTIGPRGGVRTESL